MCVEIRNKYPDLVQAMSLEQAVLAFSDFMVSDQLINKENNRYQSLRIKPTLPQPPHDDADEVDDIKVNEDNYWDANKGVEEHEKERIQLETNRVLGTHDGLSKK
jgi:hypothetical protein